MSCSIRRIYTLENGLLNNVHKELYQGSPYFMFTQDNEIVVNISIGNEITKHGILQDLRVMNKYKAKGFPAFQHIKGLTQNFINLLATYNITQDEIKEAINIGKNYDERELGVRKLAQDTSSRLAGFTVGR